MKKYILLVIPLLFFGNSILYYFQNLHYFSLACQELLNLVVIMGCMNFLLRRTALRNIVDWIIGICFSIYFCVLYSNTVQFRFLYDHIQFLVEKIRYLRFSVNLVPVKGILDVIKYNPSASYQIFGNLFMLTPLAFTMLYFKWAKSSRLVIWYSFLCTVGIELTQFLQTCLQLVFNLGMGGRSTDIDDVILNTLGAVIGVGCYLIWSKVENHFSKKLRSSNAAI